MNDFHLACLRGDVNEVRRLLAIDRSLITSRDIDGWISLHYAATNDNPTLINELLAYAIEGVQECDKIKIINKVINTKNDQDFTPLHRAVSCSTPNLDIIKTLLTNGADVNAKTYAGDTPLHYAVSDRHYDIVKLLLDYGADKTIRNKAGSLPNKYSYDSNIHQLLDSSNLDIKEPDM